LLSTAVAIPLRRIAAGDGSPLPFGRLMLPITENIMMRKHLDIIHASWESGVMRTTVTIDDDLMAVARSLAREKSESLGSAISELVRRGLNATPRVRRSARSSGFPVFSVPKGACPITLEDVRKAEDDE